MAEVLPEVRQEVQRAVILEQQQRLADDRERARGPRVKIHGSKLQHADIHGNRSLTKFEFAKRIALSTQNVAERTWALIEAQMADEPLVEPVPRSGRAWKTVRVFVTSCGRDTHSERQLLSNEIFPSLRDECRRQRVQLVECDLLWGENSFRDAGRMTGSANFVDDGSVTPGTRARMHREGGAMFQAMFKGA